MSIVGYYRALIEAVKSRRSGANAGLRSCNCWPTVGPLYAPLRTDFWSFFTHAARQCCSLYLFGGVGRGKTMLMDLFLHGPFEPSGACTHAFMAKSTPLYNRQTSPATHVWWPNASPPARPLSSTILRANIANAMILGLFEALFDGGVVVVATNVPSSCIRTASTAACSSPSSS
jgi:predicted ATPase